MLRQRNIAKVLARVCFVLPIKGGKELAVYSGVTCGWPMPLLSDRPAQNTFTSITLYTFIQSV